MRNGVKTVSTTRGRRRTTQPLASVDAPARARVFKNAALMMSPSNVPLQRRPSIKLDVKDILTMGGKAGPGTPFVKSSLVITLAVLSGV